MSHLDCWSSLSFSTSCFHSGVLLLERCRFACFVRWSLLMNLCPQRGHAYFFSPVCILRCRDSSSERAKLLSQFSQQHKNGFSPEGKNKVMPSVPTSHPVDITCMSPHMCFEVGVLIVHLGTPFKCAHMWLRSVPLRYEGVGLIVNSRFSCLC